MRLALNTITADESGEHGCDWAIIHLTPARIALLRQTFAIAAPLFDNSSFYRIEFFDDTPLFCEDSDGLEEALSPVAFSNRVFQLEENFSAGATPVETPTIVIDRYGFHWDVVTKAGVNVETEGITFDTFEQIANGTIK